MLRHETPQSSGQVAEWLKAADCKSARFSVRWFESSPVHHFPYRQRPFNAVQVWKKLGYSRRVGPPVPTAVCLQSGRNVGEVWGRNGFPPHSDSRMWGKEMWGKIWAS